MRDQGSGLAPRVDSPGLGLGLGLIAQVADSADVRAPESGGTEVLMRFNIARVLESLGMQVVRSGAAGSAALELAISHALLTRVAARELPTTLRVYRPAAAVAFGKLDALRPGFPVALDAARAHGYEPVLRLPGGHAAAYNAMSLGIDIVWALDDPVLGTHERFAVEGERLAGALRSLGVDARVGEVPGEYCPGAYSVNARGKVKLIGTAQRLVRGAALLGASIVVGDGPGVRAVLRDVYLALGIAWDDTTAGAVDEEVPASVDAVEEAVLAAYAPLEPAALDTTTLELAAELAKSRIPDPAGRAS